MPGSSASPEVSQFLEKNQDHTARQNLKIRYRQVTNVLQTIQLDILQVTCRW